MPPLTLDGDTLGEKHKHFNKLVQEAIANKQYELRNISDEDSDIDNLLKINIAAKTRNVDYIIQVIKSNDMLYAATAIKKSKWLVTEAQYAHIINPEYLHTQLLPSMNTKTFNKLMLHIRLHLKDEKRVETFYEYLKDTDGACKWLQNCSIPFIENAIKNHRVIPADLFKRLCKRSVHLIRYYTRMEASTYVVKQELLFLLKTHTADILNMVEDKEIDSYPSLGKKKTEIVMKTCPERILAKFDRYINAVDLSVATKYFNKKDIQSLLRQYVQYAIIDKRTFKPFIDIIPEEERFEFVNKTFIDKTEMSLIFTNSDMTVIEYFVKPYEWYEYAPFHVALPELEKLIRKEPAPPERCAMLSVLIRCARQNPQHIKTLISYYAEKHINEPFIFKLKFVNNLLSEVPTHEFDVETWNVLDKLFHSMDIYTETDNQLHDVQMSLQAIVTYRLLHDEPIPEIIKQKIKLGWLKQKHLNQEQENKMFSYLLDLAMEKIQVENIENESELHNNVVQLTNALNLLKDWKKDINTYPIILEKIHELVSIKEKNSWLHFNLSSLYLTNKSWRKSMFQDSLALCVSEDTCLNALKHDPQLLERHDKEIDTLRSNDAVSLRRLLAKLRVYWPHSLAQQWIDAYLLNLNNTTGHKAAFKGLFSLLPQKEVVEFAKKHVPHDFKINWGKTDPTEIRIQKNIANYLYYTRPLIPLDTVLCYAKGDYLQYAVPSLNSISHSMSAMESSEYVSKLLDAPVSLQKHGIKLAFLKLKTDDLKSLFSNIWDRTKNSSIQAVLFKTTFDKMCSVNNPTDETKLWELLRMFIDKLIKSDENGISQDIFKKLANVSEVPESVRAEYYMTSYEYLTSLPASSNCESYVKQLTEYAPDIMERLEGDFVVEKLLSSAEDNFFSISYSESIELFACYVLCGKSQEGQLKRFQTFIYPLMKKAFQCWGNIHSNDFYVKDNLKSFLRNLVWNFLKYFTSNKITVPTRLFAEIRNMMVNELPLLENYLLITSWKLVTEYVSSMNELGFKCDVFDTNILNHFARFDFGSMPNDMENLWKGIHVKVSPSFGTAAVKCLKEDVIQYSTTIHCFFSDAFARAFEMLSFKNYYFILETLQCMLSDVECITSYLVVSKVTPKHVDSELKPKRSEIRKRIRSHPSLTVQVHYYNDFWDVAED
ncbi:uncharacterized protein LOC135116646 [Helicoverpa armigera]|uniref:uncharacterized protein LOC135116646 n=1 Tax=Helicoverpa armigera TaxID=29058 RepID=UPI003083DE29